MLAAITPIIGIVAIIVLVMWVRSLPPYEESDEYKNEMEAEKERFKQYWDSEQRRKKHERQELAREIVAEMKRQGG